MYSLPAARSVDWTLAGVTGGIPTVTAIACNVRNLGATGNGTDDDTSAFEAAINLGGYSASSPKIIFIPAGTYKITRQLYPKSGQVFRGEGSNVTKLMFTFGTDPNWKHCFHLAGTVGTAYSISSGATKGSDQIVVSDGSKFAIGNTIEIYQENDISWWWTGSAMKVKGDYAGFYDGHTGWAKQARGEMAIVSGKSGNTLTLDHDLFTTLDSSKSPVARVVTPCDKVGLEYLYVHCDAQGGHQSSCWGAFFFFTYATNCWVKAVEAHMARQGFFIAERSAHLECRQSFFHDFNDPTTTGEGYLWDLRQHVTACLIEDNCADQGGMGIAPSIGACGNVFTYNYFNSHKEWLPASWGWYDQELHGWQGHHNLLEGNVIWGATIAATWGPCPYNTMFRNRVRKQIGVFDYSDYCSIIGNEVWNASNPWLIIGPSSPNIGPVTGTFVHGNEVDGSTSWDAGTSDHVLPNSFVYTSQPSWWDASCAWPAIGPDVPTDLIPSQLRYTACGKVPQP